MRKPWLCKIFTDAARLQETPGDQPKIGRRESHMLHGEAFHVHHIQDDGWAFGKSVLDDYEGWVHDRNLVYIHDEPTHIVTSLMANAHTTPDFKTLPALTLSFMSRITADPDNRHDGFIMLKNRPQLWVPESNLLPIGDMTTTPVDIVDTAMMFEGCPYGYGGRHAQGVDCSGLVQLAMQRNGLSCPRDADQQENVIGMNVTGQALQRGDIVYFPGHVGIMKDAENVINATVRHMKVIVEPMSDLIGVYGTPTSVRRLTP